MIFSKFGGDGSPHADNVQMGAAEAELVTLLATVRSLD